MSSLTSTSQSGTRSLLLTATVGATSSTSSSVPRHILGLNDDSLHTIFCEFLTPIEQSGCLSTCKKFKAVILGGTTEHTGSSSRREFLASAVCRFITTGQAKQASIAGTARFYSFQYLPEQSLLVTGDYGDFSTINLQTWNASTQQRLGVFRPLGVFKSLQRVQFDPQRELAFAAARGNDTTLCVWNTNTGAVLRTVEADDEVVFAKADFATQTCTYSTCFTGRETQNRLHIYNYETEERISFGNNDQTCNWCHDDAQRNRLLSCNTRKVLTIWDRETQQPLFTQEKVADASGKIAYDAGSGDLLFCVGNELRLLNVGEPNKQRTFSQSDKSATVTTVHHTATQVFAGFDFLEKDLGRTKVVVWGTKTGEIISSFASLNEKNFCYPLRQIDYDPSNQIVFTSGYGVQLWTLGGKRLWQTPTVTLNQTVWDKTGNKIVVFNDYSSSSQKEDGTVTIYDYAPAQEPKPESKESKSENKASS